MAGFDDDVIYGSNIDFTGTIPVSGQINLNGELLVGATTAPFIRAYVPTGSNGLVVTTGPGTLDLSLASIPNSALANSTFSIIAGSGLTGGGSASLGGSLSLQVTGPISPTTYTNHGVLIGQGGSPIVATAVGSTGQVLQGNTGADPTYSTATFPSIATGTGTILRADGTNWVASTETYAVPGTSGNLLTSNGTNWTSAAPATSGTVTSVSGTTNQVSVATGTTTPVISLVGPYTPATYTAHGVLIGEGTSSIAALAAGSAGQVLQSGGAAADPAYSTATYPAIATGTGTILRADGTNWAATTSTYPNTNAVSTLLYASSANVMAALATANDGLLVTSHTGVPSVLAGPGAAGKVLQSNSAAAPSYSTPTYPSASGTSRKILVADGTNNVYSTETWAAPGATGNILLSDGTNWTSTAGSSIVLGTGTLTNTQIKNLHGTPIQLFAGQGSGKTICLVSFYCKMIYGGSNVFTAGAAQTINLTYGAGTTNIATVLSNAGIVAAASQLQFTPGASITSAAFTLYDNTAIYLYNPVATEITGNVANNNTLSFKIETVIISI